jgi:hypothetical protein
MVLVCLAWFAATGSGNHSAEPRFGVDATTRAVIAKRAIHFLLSFTSRNRPGVNPSQSRSDQAGGTRIARRNQDILFATLSSPNRSQGRPLMFGTQLHLVEFDCPPLIFLLPAIRKVAADRLFTCRFRMGECTSCYDPARL